MHERSEAKSSVGMTSAGGEHQKSGWLPMAPPLFRSRSRTVVSCSALRCLGNRFSQLTDNLGIASLPSWKVPAPCAASVLEQDCKKAARGVARPARGALRMQQLAYSSQRNSLFLYQSDLLQPETLFKWNFQPARHSGTI